MIEVIRGWKLKLFWKDFNHMLMKRKRKERSSEDATVPAPRLLEQIPVDVFTQAAEDADVD